MTRFRLNPVENKIVGIFLKTLMQVSIISFTCLNYEYTENEVLGS